MVTWLNFGRVRGLFAGPRIAPISEFPAARFPKPEVRGSSPLGRSWLLLRGRGLWIMGSAGRFGCSTVCSTIAGVIRLG